MKNTATILNTIAGGLEETGGGFTLTYYPAAKQWLCTIRRSDRAADTVLAVSHESAGDAVEKALDMAGWFERYDKEGNPRV